MCWKSCAPDHPELTRRRRTHRLRDGLVLILKELHDRLDVAVAEAYGWPADSTTNKFWNGWWR